MNIWYILHSVIFLAIAFVVGRHVWRGLKRGRLLVGIGSAGECWLVRSEDPVSYWIVMFLLSMAVAALGYGAALPLVQATTFDITIAARHAEEE